MKANYRVGFIGSSWGVFFSSIAALSLGVTLGVWSLLTTPVKIVDFLPSAPAPRQIFYQRGRDNPTFDWREKFLTLSRRPLPRSLAFTSGDLSAFFKTASSEGQSSMSARIHNGQLHLGAQTYPSWLSFPLCLQAQGEFLPSSSGGGARYAVLRAYLGSLPLPGFVAQPLVAAIVTQSFDRSSQPQLQSIVDAWKSATAIQIKGERLILSWN